MQLLKKLTLKVIKQYLRSIKSAITQQNLSMMNLNKKMLTKIDRDNIIFNDINSKERRELITKKLFKFNQSQSKQVVECDRLQTDTPTFIEVYAEVKPQKLIGGLISYIDWGQWLYIDTIWVDVDYRGQGIGKYLIKSAEQKARNKGIKRARLWTFDFQALNFYKKLGYTVYGELEDFPEGHTAYYLKKILLEG